MHKNSTQYPNAPFSMWSSETTTEPENVATLSKVEGYTVVTVGLKEKFDDVNVKVTTNPLNITVETSDSHNHAKVSADMALTHTLTSLEGVYYKEQDESVQVFFPNSNFIKTVSETANIPKKS